MSRQKGISVGTEITGNAKGFKAAAEDAKKATASLRQKAEQDSKALDKAFKQVGLAMGAVVSATALAKKALDIYSNAMSSTAASADTLKANLASVDAAINTIYRSMLRADFSNLASDIKRAMKAAQEYTMSEDVADTRLSDLQLRKSALQNRIDELRTKQREGGLTKPEVSELERLSLEIFDTEKDIYQRRISEAIKFGASKDKVDKELFNNLQDGVIARSYLSDQEMKELSKVPERYESMRKKLQEEFTQINYIMTESGQVAYKTFNSEGFTVALNQFISTLSGIERVQLFEDVFSTQEEWERLISFMVEINRLENEHIKNMKMTSRVKGSATETMLPRTNITGIASIAPGRLVSQTPRQETGLAEMKMFQSEIQYSTQLLNELESSFRDLFAATGGGFEEMADAFISAIQRMAAEALAKMAVFALLNALTGGGGALANWASQMLGGRNLSQFMGFTTGTNFVPKSGGGMGQQNINLKVSGKLHGRDILLSAARYNQVLNENT